MKQRWYKIVNQTKDKAGWSGPYTGYTYSIGNPEPLVPGRLCRCENGYHIIEGDELMPWLSRIADSSLTTAVAPVLAHSHLAGRSYDDKRYCRTITLGEPVLITERHWRALHRLFLRLHTGTYRGRPDLHEIIAFFALLPWDTKLVASRILLRLLFTDASAWGKKI